MAEDSIFVRDGADIYVDSNISFTQVRAKYVSHFHYFWTFNHLIKEGKDLNTLVILHTNGEHTFLLLGLMANQLLDLGTQIPIKMINKPYEDDP